MSRTMADPAPPNVPPEARFVLLRHARAVLAAHLGEAPRPSPLREPPEILAPGAAFVTLRDADTGALRGCRGEVEATRPLVESVVAMAISSAVDDPRFTPVRAHELDALTIEINALSPMVPVVPDNIRVGVHGLWIRRGAHAGLLLPEVAVDFGWTREEFLVALCQKARLPEDAWRDTAAELHAFVSTRWGEAAGSHRVL